MKFHTLFSGSTVMVSKKVSTVFILNTSLLYKESKHPDAVIYCVAYVSGEMLQLHRFRIATLIGSRRTWQILVMPCVVIFAVDISVSWLFLWHNGEIGPGQWISNSSQNWLERFGKTWESWSQFDRIRTPTLYIYRPLKYRSSVKVCACSSYSL